MSGVAVVFGLCALSFAAGCVLTAVMLRREQPPEPTQQPAPAVATPRFEPHFPPEDYATKPIHRNPVMGIPAALPAPDRPTPRPNLVAVPDPVSRNGKPARQDGVRRMHVVRAEPEPAGQVAGIVTLAQPAEPAESTEPALAAIEPTEPAEIAEQAQRAEAAEPAVSVVESTESAEPSAETAGLGETTGLGETAEPADRDEVAEAADRDKAAEPAGTAVPGGAVEPGPEPAAGTEVVQVVAGPAVAKRAFEAARPEAGR